MRELFASRTWKFRSRAGYASLVLLLLLSSCARAGAQREAVKNTAGDASATKADPPAHSETKGKHGASFKKTAGAAPSPKDDAPPHAPDDKAPTAYAFGLPTEDGKNLPLSEYKGKVLLIVNLARESTYASQLQALQKLNDTFKDKGLVVLGVPSNDFGASEPGTGAEVAKFYTDAKVDFPVMGISSLTGVHELPLFGYLTKAKTIPDNGLHWNYTKFVVDRTGKVILRFPPEVAPDSLQMIATLQEVLDGTWKPKKAPAGKGEEAAGDDDDD